MYTEDAHCWKCGSHIANKSFGYTCRKKQHIYCSRCTKYICIHCDQQKNFIEKKCNQCYFSTQLCICKRIPLRLSKNNKCSKCLTIDQNNNFFCNPSCGHLLCKICWMDNRSSSCQYSLCNAQIDNQSASIFFQRCINCKQQSFCEVNPYTKQNRCRLCQYLKPNVNIKQDYYSKYAQTRFPRQPKSIYENIYNQFETQIPKINILNAQHKLSRSQFIQTISNRNKSPDISHRSSYLERLDQIERKERQLRQKINRQSQKIYEPIRNKSKDLEERKLDNYNQSPQYYKKVQEQIILRSREPIKKSNIISEKYPAVSQYQLNRGNYINKLQQVKIPSQTSLSSQKLTNNYQSCQSCKKQLSSEFLLQNCEFGHRICRDCILQYQKQKNCFICTNILKASRSRTSTNITNSSKIGLTKGTVGLCSRCNVEFDLDNLFINKGEALCRYCIMNRNIY